MNVSVENEPKCHKMASYWTQQQKQW